MFHFLRNLQKNSLFIELWRKVKNAPLLYVGGIFFVLITNIQEILTPKFLQWTIDLLSKKDVNVVPGVFRTTSTYSTLHTLGFCFILVSLCAWLGRWGWRHTLARATHIAARELRHDFWDKTSLMQMSLLDRYPVGDLMNRVTSDWNAARFIFGFTLVLTLDVVFVTVIAFVSMFLMDAPFALLCLCLFPIVFRPIYKRTVKQRSSYEKAQQQLSVLCDYISQSLHTIRLQKATNTEGMWIKNLEKEAKKYADLRYAAMKEGWKLFPLATLPSILCFAVLFSFGLYRWSLGYISVGEFIALHSYILVLQIPLYELGDCIAEWQKGLAGLSRIQQVQELAVASSKSRVLARELSERSPFKSLELRDLNVELSPNQLGFPTSIRIKAGEKVLIQGPVGSGKSLLFLKLTGLKESEIRQFFINGLELNQYSKEQLGEFFSLQEQKVFIYRGSIRSNLSLGGSFSDEELWMALYRVSLDEEFRSLPQGLDTVLQENGINLSGGQKQRLSLARILLRQNPVWLLDDPLSAVDRSTELRIIERMRDLIQNRTILFCTSREPPPIQWDQRIVFKNRIDENVDADLINSSLLVKSKGQIYIERSPNA